MLQQLPEELLDRILCHVAAFPFIYDPYTEWQKSKNSWIPHQLRSTLLNICLASKTLYRLALPHLYKAFSNHAANFAETNRVVDSGSPELPLRAIAPLHDVSARYLRTLCARPDYGNLLRSLSISVKDPPTTIVPRVTSNEELADLAPLSKIAMNFWFGATWTIELHNLLLASLLKRKPDATVCMILLMCPNIETLEISGGTEEGGEDPLVNNSFAFLMVIGTTHVVGAFAPLQRSLILQRVRSLILAVYPLQPTWTELMAVFSLPALRTLRMQYLCSTSIYDDGPDRWTTLGPPHCSTLKSLELDSLSIPGLQFAEMLKWCPNLTMLNATWRYFSDHVPVYDPAFHEVGKAVSKYNRLLVSLKLVDQSHVPQGSRLCFTLQGLQHLTHVELNSDSVWCHPSNHIDAISDNLPNSIESLFIFEDGQVPDNLPPDDSSPDSDSRFDDACVVDPFSEDQNGDLCQCRTRDIRRLLLDERLTRLRRVTFSEKVIYTIPEDAPSLFHQNDPHVLSHIWTPAIRRRGWKLLQRPTILGHTTHTEAVLYREMTDGIED
ncbi:hypothetical protein Q7P36_006180 [Cladosporium allicinum]